VSPNSRHEAPAYQGRKKGELGKVLGLKIKIKKSVEFKKSAREIGRGGAHPYPKKILGATYLDGEVEAEVNR